MRSPPITALMIVSLALGALIGGAFVVVVGMDGVWPATNATSTSNGSAPASPDVEKATGPNYLATLVKQGETPSPTATSTSRPTKTPDPHKTATPTKTSVPMCEPETTGVCEKKYPTPGPTATTTPILSCSNETVRPGEMCDPRGGSG